MSEPPESLGLSEEGRSFLQRRVALFGQTGAALGGFFLVFRAAQCAWHNHFAELTRPDWYYHVAATASLLGIWLVCRSGRRSVAVVRTTETVGLLLAATFYSAMGTEIPALNMPHLIVILALSFGLFARSVFVPSHARRTLLLSMASGIPLLVMTYRIYAPVDWEDWRGFIPDLPPDMPTSLATLKTMWSAAWWFCAVVLCTAASRVIYGLRKEVRDISKLGQYTLTKKLGEGSMGEVYRASHAMLRRPTAIKLLPPEKTGERALARFEKEVQLTAQLTHPNTVTIFDYGRTPDGVFYYAMELLEGPTLAEVVEVDGPQPAARVIRILLQAAEALGEAHDVGLIHRDIKPANMLLVRQGGRPDVLKVVDFGLVKELKAGEDASVTQADTITGTPHYLSPEAIVSADDVDGRSDLYSLGAVGFFLLTGTQVFDAQSVVEVCSMHLHTEPTPPSERLGRAVPADLERVILRCLKKKPAERFQRADELCAELKRCEAAGQWSESNAQDWWQTHGWSRVRPESSGMTLGMTMDIDLAR